MSRTWTLQTSSHSPSHRMWSTNRSSRREWGQVGVWVVVHFLHSQVQKIERQSKITWLQHVQLWMGIWKDSSTNWGRWVMRNKQSWEAMAICSKSQLAQHYWLPQVQAETGLTTEASSALTVANSSYGAMKKITCASLVWKKGETSLQFSRDGRGVSRPCANASKDRDLVSSSTTTSDRSTPVHPTSGQAWGHPQWSCYHSCLMHSLLTSLRTSQRDSAYKHVVVMVNIPLLVQVANGISLINRE